MTCSISRLFCLAVLAASLTSRVFANEPPSPQYRNISPMPGGGTALNSNGEPDGKGAVQINIPVAYTPHWGYVNTAVYQGSHDTGPGENGNGSGILAMGFGGRPSLYISGLQVSHILNESKALNMQAVLLQEKSDTPAFAFGVQDLLNKEHATTGRSYYGVATKSLSIWNHEAYVTLGFGNSRFVNKPFGGISVPVGDFVNVIVEYDGFQINSGATYRPFGRYGNLTLLGGLNFRTGWLLGASQTFQISR